MPPGYTLAADRPQPPATPLSIYLSPYFSLPLHQNIHLLSILFPVCPILCRINKCLLTCDVTTPLNSPMHAQLYWRKGSLVRGAQTCAGQPCGGGEGPTAGAVEESERLMGQVGCWPT